jgi:16S rRNA (adenine1518-N6/adenine1519-N6)-dimethyltransferase
MPSIPSIKRPGDVASCALSCLPSLRDVIARHGLAARHSLGQHFLLDGNLTDRIVREAGDLSERHVIEVGPGPGGLTRSLLRSAAATITTIELDGRAISAVTELAEVAGDRLRVVEGNALSIDAASLVPPPRQIIANLPYNVASPLLVRWLRHAASFERLTLMFQQEVAERICAEPATPAYGRLSVLTQWTCNACIVMRLPPTAFTPPPKVSSAVVSLTPHDDQPNPSTFARMEALTAAAFGQRRKMLRGSLRVVGGEVLLAQAGIDPERRAETLSIEEFDRLVRLPPPL